MPAPLIPLAIAGAPIAFKVGARFLPALGRGARGAVAAIRGKPAVGTAAGTAASVAPAATGRFIPSRRAVAIGGGAAAGAALIAHPGIAKAASERVGEAAGGLVGGAASGVGRGLLGGLPPVGKVAVIGGGILAVGAALFVIKTALK